MVIYFFSVRLLSVLHGHPRHIGQWLPTSKDFLSQIWSITLFSYLNSSERASISPFQCWVLNKGTTGTIFITSLVWHGLWLGIEPGTSRTQSQHSTTRLSRRRLFTFEKKLLPFNPVNKSTKSFNQDGNTICHPVNLLRMSWPLNCLEHV